MMFFKFPKRQKELPEAISFEIETKVAAYATELMRDAENAKFTGIAIDYVIDCYRESLQSIAMHHLEKKEEVAASSPGGVRRMMLNGCIK